MCELVPAYARQSCGEEHGKEHAMILPMKAMEGDTYLVQFWCVLCSLYLVVIKS